MIFKLHLTTTDGNRVVLHIDLKEQDFSVFHLNGQISTVRYMGIMYEVYRNSIKVDIN